MTTLALILSVLIILLTQVSSEKVIKFYKIECECNENYISNLSCFLKVPERGVVQSNGFMVLKEHLRDVQVRSELLKFEDRYKPYMMNVTVNLCDFVKGNKIQNLIVSSVIKTLEKNSNTVRCGHAVRNSLSFQFFYINLFVVLAR